MEQNVNLSRLRQRVNALREKEQRQKALQQQLPNPTLFQKYLLMLAHNNHAGQ